jgi:cytochrome b
MRKRASKKKSERFPVHENREKAPGVGTPTPVWDRATRLVHWAFAPLILFLWWTAHSDRMDWHRWAGFAVLGLLVFRLAWGVLGGSTARFAHFVKGPAAAFAYGRGLFSKNRKAAVVGHSPLGGWSVLALIATLCSVVGFGLFAEDVDGIESGPLTRFVDFDTARTAARLHHLAFNVLLWLIGLHLLAIAFYALARRENLVGPMFTGRRSLPEGSEKLKPAAVWRLAASLALAAAAVALAVKG